jgi:large subunit ribosomal protein L10
MSKAERQSTVAQLTADLKASPNVFVTNFSGLNVLKLTVLRRRLRVAGARYVVVKNTLAQRALAANGITVLDEHLAGPIGLVLAGTDPLPAAKVIFEFVKENEKPTVKGGLVDGKAVEVAYVKRLGEIPPRDVLLGQFVGVLNSMLSTFVLTLEAYKDQLAGPAETAAPSTTTAS